MPIPVKHDRTSWEHQKRLNRADEERQWATEDWRAVGMIFLGVGCCMLLVLAVLACFHTLFR
ncbi:MAG: hypothetical protein REU00_14695 [Pseudomonadota bacterium]|nr:hypothetical protein [Pseudomonadota bacterium]